MLDSEQHIVLVLGAGASAPYGFPTGKELVRKISSGFYEGFCKLLGENRSVNPSSYNQFEDKLRNADPDSIDRFLENQRPHIRDVGKKAIACILLPLENQDTLVSPKDKNDGWYSYLWSIVSKCKMDDFPACRVSIITYNYDRSLEQYLYDAIESYYDITNPATTKELVHKIEIVHIHGQLGFLPWQGKGPAVKYFSLIRDQATRFEALGQATDSIKIIYEKDDIEKDETLVRARQLLGTATTLVFLGFGFDDVNLQRLQLENVPRNARVFFTAFHLTDKEIGRRLSKLQRYLKPSTTMVIKEGKTDWKSLKLLREFTCLPQV